MLFRPSFKKDYSDGPIVHLNFECLNSNTNNSVFSWGIDAKSINLKNGNNPTIYFETEEPNRFHNFNENGDLGNHDSFEDYWTRILSICPYSVKWLNKKYRNKKREWCWYPFNKNITPKSHGNYEYDVCYVGGTSHGYRGELKNMAETISKFNYALVCVSEEDDPLSIATHYNLTNRMKLETVSRSKISVVCNLLFENHVGQYDFFIKGKYLDWHKNEAFSHLDDGIMPQLKPRLLETAISKSLILCRKDPWNLIELLFKEGEDFIFYEPGNLEQTIKDCLNNYSHCEKLIESAYQKAMKYDVESYNEKFLKGYDL